MKNESIKSYYQILDYNNMTAYQNVAQCIYFTTFYFLLEEMMLIRSMKYFNDEISCRSVVKVGELLKRNGGRYRI